MTTIKRETALGDGLYLDNRSGSYLWRGRLNSKPKTLRITHPNGRVATDKTLKVKEARRLAKQIGVDASEGGERFFGVTPEGSGVTVEQAWDAYWKREGSKLVASKEKHSHWTNFIKPAWQGRALSSITKRDCAALIEQRLVEAQLGGQVGTAANNLQKNLKRFFSWCVDSGGYGFTGLEASPMSALKAKPVDVKLTKRKSRALDKDELGWFFRALQAYATTIKVFERPESKRRIAEAHEFLLRSLCRSEEVLGAKWRQVREDGLFIPDTKMGYKLLLPLSPSMRALIGGRPAGASPDDTLWGFSGTYIQRELAEIRERMTAAASADGSNADFHTAKFDGQHNPHYFTGHDYRDSGKRFLGKVSREDGLPKFPLEVREAMLNHREKAIAATYNSELDAEDYMLAPRVIAGREWNEWLDELKADAIGAKKKAT